MLTISSAFSIKIISMISHTSHSICLHIQFTIEKEHNFSLPFFDVLIKRNSRNGSKTKYIPLSATIYRKPSHTNRYLHDTSHITPNIRSSLLPKLYSAGLTLTSQITHRSTVNTHITDNTRKHSELLVRSTLQLNGFPTRATFLTSRQPRSQNTQYNHFTFIPYIQGTSEKVRRVLIEARVKVAMKPVHAIGRNFPSPKDPLTLKEKSCLVYQVPCFDCDLVHIEQTKPDLKSRLAEHKLAIRNQEPEKSNLCEHSIQFDHLIDWNNSKVLKTEDHCSKQLTSEAWFINSHPHIMNRSDDDSLPRVYCRSITS